MRRSRARPTPCSQPIHPTRPTHGSRAGSTGQPRFERRGWCRAHACNRNATLLACVFRRVLLDAPSAGLLIGPAHTPFGALGWADMPLFARAPGPDVNASICLLFGYLGWMTEGLGVNLALCLLCVRCLGPRVRRKLARCMGQCALFWCSV